MKNTEKELASMQKKHDKVKDWRALARVQQKMEEDKVEIARLEKQNRKLRAEQKRGEYKLAKNSKREGIN